ncbi:mucin-22-like isoform X2 [Palaemon carinicauda]|uniref:mucin-22-like isoform X2 n=1 Tax=Palaemon carinicauda TaxID=392227 RepID=UPI0035B6704B
MTSLHWMRSGVRAVWALLLFVGVTQAMQKRSASASPTPTPDPNLAALTGLGGIGTLPGGASANGNNGNGGTCNNQDLLTNLLVYQYLSGSIPNGGGPAGSNPQLQALLGSAGPPTTTVTSVSTTLTTLVVEVEPSTHYTTSTTSYVTTLTSVETKIIPVLFRGSKITTTISESSEEVITATEFFTDSSVHSPSIVQTLPVHITMTATSTRGVNGQYTLHELTPGPTSVIHQPVSTTTFDFDAAGLDLGNLDLSQLDLASLTGGGLGGFNPPGDDNQMLSILSSLLQNYDDPEADAGFDPAPRTRFGTNGRSADGRRNAPFSSRRTRFEDPFQNDYDDYDAVVDEPPKFNVITGFVLSDHTPSSGGSSGSGTGRAATDTRYSKYHRKDKVDNNGIATTTDANTRESERYSASNPRRTFSRSSNTPRRTTEDRTSRPPSTRFVPAAESQYFEDGPPKFRPFGTRNDREISRRRSGVQEDNTPSSRPISAPRPKATQRNIVPVDTPSANVRTTVLTMYLSGTVPGEFSTSLRTVTLRSLATRRRRDTNEEPITKIAATTSSSLKMTENTILPDIPPGGINSKEIVHLLKTLKPDQVKKMLKSLQNWVDYYNHELLDEEDNTLRAKQETKEETKHVNAPELTSSINVENTETETEATTALPLSPSSISGQPSSLNFCYPPPTVTETVYRTFVITSGMSPA